jgi:hypothetical protein
VKSKPVVIWDFDGNIELAQSHMGEATNKYYIFKQNQGKDKQSYSQLFLCSDKTTIRMTSNFGIDKIFIESPFPEEEEEEELEKESLLVAYAVDDPSGEIDTDITSRNYGQIKVAWVVADHNLIPKLFVKDIYELFPIEEWDATMQQTINNTSHSTVTIHVGDACGDAPIPPTVPPSDAIFRRNDGVATAAISSSVTFNSLLGYIISLNGNVNGETTYGGDDGGICYDFEQSLLANHWRTAGNDTIEGSSITSNYPQIPTGYNLREVPVSIGYSDFEGKETHLFVNTAYITNESYSSEQERYRIVPWLVALSEPESINNDPQDQRSMWTISGTEDGGENVSNTQKLYFKGLLKHANTNTAAVSDKKYDFIEYNDGRDLEPWQYTSSLHWVWGYEETEVYNFINSGILGGFWSICADVYDAKDIKQSLPAPNIKVEGKEIILYIVVRGSTGPS